MRKPAVRPYLITKDEDGTFRITVRTTRMNSQGYPLVTTSPMEGSFASMTMARSYVREHFNAEAADIATK